MLLVDLHIFEVANWVIGDVSKQSAVYVFAQLFTYLKAVPEIFEEVCDLTDFRYLFLFRFSIWILNLNNVFFGLKRGDWIAADEWQTVLMTMIVGAFEQNAAGINIPQFKIDVHGRKRISQ